MVPTTRLRCCLLAEPSSSKTPCASTMKYMARRICDVSERPLPELCYMDRSPTAGWHARSFKSCAAT
eukprot:8408019-Prorocentrum_lima.AAC.1